MTSADVHAPWTIWLEGEGWGGNRLFTRPRRTLQTYGGVTRIADADGTIHTSPADPLELVEAALAEAGPDAVAAGYFSYDLARRWLPLAALPAAGPVADMAIGIYDALLLLTPEEGALTAPAAISLDAPPSPHQDFAAYSQAFDRIQAYIRAGDCYQVNYALRFAAPCAGDVWPLYQALRRRNPAPYAAWLNLPGTQVLSSSPESFLHLADGLVTTRPIKGTRPRGATPEADAQLAAELAASPKDRAENLMIVDLLRNDLGKVCVPGSVVVPALFAVEPFATVQHLVSTVQGRLRPGKTALDLLRATLPGGSITGAPKHRAMQIIDELEPAARGVYCGAIGWLKRDAMHLNIAIRTAVAAGGEVSFWAGGGLVADSEVVAEYQECLDKARALRETLADFGPATGPEGA